MNSTRTTTHPTAPGTITLVTDGTAIMALSIDPSRKKDTGSSGYRWGVPLKQALLAREQTMVAPAL